MAYVREFFLILHVSLKSVMMHLENKTISGIKSHVQGDHKPRASMYLQNQEDQRPSSGVLPCNLVADGLQHRPLSRMPTSPKSKIAVSMERVY